MSKTKATVAASARGASWRDYLKKQLENPEFRAEYDALEPEFALIQQLIDIRNKRGLSQRQLAERAGMKQPVIARLESGRAAGLRTLKRLAEALDSRLEIKIVPHKASSERAAGGSKRTRTKRA